MLPSGRPWSVPAEWRGNDVSATAPWLKLVEVRRASWSDVAPPPPPESDDEAVDGSQFCSASHGPRIQVIEFTKEDLFKEDAPMEEQPEKSPEAGEARVTHNIVLVRKT